MRLSGPRPYVLAGSVLVVASVAFVAAAAGQEDQTVRKVAVPLTGPQRGGWLGWWGRSPCPGRPCPYGTPPAAERQPVGPQAAMPGFPE